MLTHNETVQIQRVMDAFTRARHVIDEVVIVDDFSCPDCVSAIRSFEGKLPLRFYQRALKHNFAKQRNYMKSLCRGELIFFIDPDEIPPECIVLGLPKILEVMKQVNIEACTLPRVTIVHDEREPMDLPTWNLDTFGHSLLWEDQFRILRNLPHLHWTMSLNEYLTGMRRCFRFPSSSQYVLLHPKSITRGQQQRGFYRSFRWRRPISKLKNSIMKRVPWRPAIEWIDMKAPV